MHLLREICPNKYSITVIVRMITKKEVSQEQVKDNDNFSVCSDWDADLDEQDLKKL